MILNALFVILLALVQTPQAADDGGSNVFVDLGSEHCAQSIATAAYQNTEAAELAAADAPAFVTYSAFEFESADQANAALDDLHMRVADTFSDEPDISQSDEFDDIVAEFETEEMGDRSVAYTMHLPVDSEEFDVLFIDVMGIVKENQLALTLLFAASGGDDASPGLSGNAVLPFVQMVDDAWDGTGDIENAIPAQDEMPIGWEGEGISSSESPACE